MGSACKSCKLKNPAKVRKVLKEYKEGDLHSGSKSGPLVKKRSQALAIALNEARRGVAKHLHPKSIRVSSKNNRGDKKSVIGKF